MTRRKIIISGGGIAGLTAALCLSKNGNRVNVYEKSQRLDPLGAGLQISPNAYHVLNSLGLGKAVRDQGDAPNTILMMNAKNAQALARLPLGLEFEDKYTAPYLVIHRSDLHSILLEKCETNSDIDIHLGSQVIDCVSHQNGVTAIVQSEGGLKERTADVLVAADGVHSTIRNEVLEMPKAMHSGKTAWRALIPASAIKNNTALNNTTVWLGPKAHAVSYPIRNKSFLNVIAVTQETDTAKNIEIPSEELALKFDHWSDEFTGLFTKPGRWTGWPIFEMKPPTKMVEGNITLIGDAAHAMLPFAAQGAAQAIEDAYILARSVSTHDNTETALTEFEKERLPRVREVMKTASRNGRIYHLTGMLASSRNLALKTISGDKLLQQQDWIYRWRT